MSPHSNRFAPGFPGFAGHFPGDPVLPAVVQISLAVALAGEGEGRPLRLAGVRSAKFLLPIRPNDEVLVRCRARTDGAERLHDVEFTTAGGAAAVVLLDLVEAREAG